MTARFKANIEFSADVRLSEAEIRALDALVGYGDDAFIKNFKEKLGETYIRDHEAGLKKFFTTVREHVLPAMRDIDTARGDINAAIFLRDAGARK